MIYSITYLNLSIFGEVKEPNGISNPKPVQNNNMTPLFCKSAVASRNNVITSTRMEYVSLRDSRIMKKLNNKWMRLIIREIGKGEQSTYRIAKQQGITPRHARRLHARYKDLKPYPIDTVRLQKPGRKPTPMGDYERKVVLQMYISTSLTNS